MVVSYFGAKELDEDFRDLALRDELLTDESGSYQIGFRCFHVGVDDQPWLRFFEFVNCGVEGVPLTNPDVAPLEYKPDGVEGLGDERV